MKMRAFSQYARSGMTIAEVMIASAIALVVSAGAMWLIVQGTVSSWRTSNMSGNDLAHWGLSNRLVFDSRKATELTVYSDFTTAAITAEGEAGLKSYTPEKDVGNFLVLALRTPDYSTGLQCCSKITGYVYKPADKTLYQFFMNVEVAHNDDFKSGMSVPDLLVKYYGEFRLSVVATNLVLPTLASGGSQAAFYWPPGDADSNTNSRKAILRVRLGNTKQDRRIRDSRLFEVAFFIRA
jgi:hypothetical protein